MHERLRVGALFLLGCGAAAQTPAPNPHWGACIYPPARPEVRGAFSFNRFTEFTSTGKKYPAAIEETSGFNIFNVSHTDEIVVGRRHRFTYTFNVSAGYTSDQPTEFLQNRYIHELRDLDPVKVEDKRTRSEYGGGAALHWWGGTGEAHVAADGHGSGDDDDLRLEYFVGAGVTTSTIYHEAFVEVGGSLFIPAWRIKLIGVDRAAWPHDSDAYPEVAHFSNILQGGLAYVPKNTFLGGNDWRWSHLWPWNWHDLIGRPEAGIYLTWDTGLFVDATDNDPLSTNFVSIRFDWNTGLRLETWNDFANGTDYGPTYGVMLSFDFRTLFRRDQ